MLANITLVFSVMGRNSSPPPSVDVNAPRRLRSGAITSADSSSVRKRPAAASGPSFASGIPLGDRIGPPRGIAPTRPKAVPRTRKEAIVGDVESFKNDPFNLSSRFSTAALDYESFISNILFGPEQHLSRPITTNLLRPFKPAPRSPIPSSPPGLPTSSIPPSSSTLPSSSVPASFSVPASSSVPAASSSILPSSSLPPSSPPTQSSSPTPSDPYSYNYTYTPKQTPNGTWKETGQLRYVGPAPTLGRGGARNDRTAIVEDGVHYPIPAGYVAPYHRDPYHDGDGLPEVFDFGCAVRDEEEDDPNAGMDEEGNDPSARMDEGEENAATDVDADMSWEGVGEQLGLDVNMKDSGAESSSDSGVSGSDYEEYRKRKEGKRDRLRKRGEECTDTEEEDVEEDEELRHEVVDDSTPCRPGRKHQRQMKRRRLQVHRSPRSPPRISSKAKGKGRAVEVENPKGSKKDSGKGNEGEGEKGGRDDEPMDKVRGRLSKEANQKISEFGKDIHDMADEMAVRYRKDRSTILQLAGLNLSTPRSPNFYNQYKMWFSQKKPDTSGMLDPSYLVFYSMLLISSYLGNLKQFTQTVKDAYEALWEGVDRDDAEACDQVMKPILDDLEAMEHQSELQMAPSARMKTTLERMQKFVSMSKPISQAN
jgi:hypothetical protein